MAQHVYALFVRREDAAAALDEVRSAGCESESCNAILHEGELDKSELSLTEQGGKEMGPRGAVITGTVGAVAAGIAAAILGAPALAAAAAAGGVAALYGLLAGGISGSDDPERALRTIQDEVEQGKTLIALEVDDNKLREMCEQVFEKHGGYQIVA